MLLEKKSSTLDWFMDPCSKSKKKGFETILVEIWTGIVEMLLRATVGHGSRTSLRQGSAGACLPPGILTRSNLFLHSPLPPASTHPFLLLNATLTPTYYISLFTFFLPSSRPPAGGIGDGVVWQGSEPVLWREVAGDFPRTKLPGNNRTGEPRREGKEGGGHGRLWRRLCTA